MGERGRDYQPDEQVPGTVYRVVRRIGAGGMGTVYDVEDTTIGKRYVLKTLHAQLGAREDLARRMQNEARTLARLHHPNIVEVITAGVTADDLRLPYYVMERLNGQSVRVVLEKKGRLELAHAYHIGIDLLDALDHAHDKGVIHRDVKPDNIFLHRTSAGVTLTKLLDFGIVSVLDDAGRDTAGRFLGTLRYAAPEQLRGEKPTPKTDVYAAALVLYEIVAGRGPFDEEGDGHRIAAAHMSKAPPAVSCFVAVPTELDALLLAALAKNPEARPRDAFSFAASLRNLKRVLTGPVSREATEARTTGPAVLGPNTALTQRVYVRQPSPDGPYVISPLTRTATPTSPSLPTTTIHGMAPPTLAPSWSLSPTATSPDAVDRVAATHSISSDTPPFAQHGTESLPPLDSEPPLSAPLEWPAERGLILSEEPQVQSLPAAGIPRRPVGPLVAGVLGMAGLVLLGAALVAGRHESRTGVLPAVVPLAASFVTVQPIEPVVTVPAPTIAPPAFDDPSPAPVAGAALASRPPVAPPLTASAPPPSKPPTKAPAALHFAADRPGPGF
jgi:serine/threonine-protein kinase